MTDATIYGVQAVLKIFEEHGVKISRAAFNQSHLPHLLDGKWAVKRFGLRGGVEFDRRYVQHWIAYVTAVHERQAAGKMAKNYKYNDGDMQCFIDGAWEET